MLNRQRYFDKSREYIQEKVQEAIVPSLSTLRTTQYGTAEEKILAEEIFNYAATEIKISTLPSYYTLPATMTQLLNGTNHTSMVG